MNTLAPIMPPGLRGGRMSDAHRKIAPVCHEFQAHWNANEHGLQPWFAFDRVTKDAGGGIGDDDGVQIEALGDSWTVTLQYQESAVLPPVDGETSAGTAVKHDTIREFRLNVEADDDVGQRSANYHIRPRWQGMEAETNDGLRKDIPVPEWLANHDTDAINIRISGSNIPFDEYGTLLREAAEAVGVSRNYFKTEYRHRTSNIQDAARYVRLHTDVSGPVFGETGPLVTLARVLETDREGYRKLVRNHEDYHGENLPGYYVTATLGQQRVQEVMPNHKLPVECKHYYAKDALNRPMSDPLRHPKLEVAYQQSRWDESLAYTEEEIDNLTTELDEWLFAILRDAGSTQDIPLRAGSAYFADAYFDAENGMTDANIVTLDLVEIKNEQQSIVHKHTLTDGGVSPIEGEILGELVADGGTKSPKDVAEKHDRDRDSVYAALKRMHDLVQHDYGELSLKSTYQAELVADALEHANDAVERATMAAAEAKEAAQRGLDENTSAFLAWCQKYGIEREAMGDYEGTIDLGEIEDPSDVREIIREGYRLWTEMNRDPAEFRSAKVRYDVYEENQASRLRSIDTQQNESGHWRTRLAGRAHTLI
jgi:hypothetical protein